MKDLPAIGAAYEEIAADLDRKLEIAREAANQQAIDWIEKQQIINDSAYFILAWGQLEAKLNDACEAAIRIRLSSADWEIRRAWDSHNPENMRAKLEDRVALVLDRTTDVYRKVIRYYGERNRVAHGTSLASGIDVPFIIGEFFQIVSELRG